MPPWRATAGISACQCWLTAQMTAAVGFLQVSLAASEKIAWTGGFGLIA